MWKMLFPRCSQLAEAMLQSLPTPISRTCNSWQKCSNLFPGLKIMPRVALLDKTKTLLAQDSASNKIETDSSGNSQARLWGEPPPYCSLSWHLVLQESTGSEHLVRMDGLWITQPWMGILADKSHGKVQCCQWECSDCTIGIFQSKVAMPHF